MLRLVALLIDGEGTSKNDDKKTHKNHVGFDHGFNGREKNTVTIAFPHEVTSTFFLALTMQKIALQMPEKYSKRPLNVALNCDSLLQPLLYLDD